MGPQQKAQTRAFLVRYFRRKQTLATAGSRPGRTVEVAPPTAARNAALAWSRLWATPPFRVLGPPLLAPPVTTEWSGYRKSRAARQSGASWASSQPMRIAMENENSISPKRTAWNKGKLIGAKPPLLARHVWSIRTKLQIEGRTRDLAMFNLAIDSKLRGCDVVAIKVEDVAPNGYAIARATVRQRKTGRPVRFELTEQTRQAVDDYLKAAGKMTGEYLFTSRRRLGEALTTICAARREMDCRHRA